MTGISLLPEAVATARVVGNPHHGTPVLRFCDVRPTRTASEQGSELATLAAEHALEGVECVSVLPSSAFSLLLVEKPNVEASELKTAVRWRIKDLLDFHVDDAVVDVFEVPGQEERGRPPMMYVVAAHQGTVREHIDLIEGTGACLAAIDIPELAQRNLAVMLPEDEGGVATLYLSETRGLLTLTRKGVLYLARNLDVGAAQLRDHAVATDQADEADEGMQLEEQEGLPPGLEQDLEGIVLEVQRSLDYYESHFSLPPIGNLVLAPMAYEVPGMMGYIANQLGVGVRELDLNTILDCETTLAPVQQARAFQAIGAALRREGNE